MKHKPAEEMTHEELIARVKQLEATMYTIYNNAPEADPSRSNDFILLRNYAWSFWIAGKYAGAAIGRSRDEAQS